MASGSVLMPLRRRDFRRLWIAQTVSIVGDKINQIGLIILVGTLTGSAAQMGIVIAITFLPAALFGLVAGPLVDRWDRRRTMIVADLSRAVLVAAIALVVTAHAPAGPTIALCYVLAFASATVSLFFEPSRMALVPAIVEENELMAANALDMTTSSVAELLGIGFGGALVATIGPGSAFWIDAVTFLISAVFVAGVGHRTVQRVLRKLDFGVIREDLVAGFDRIRRDGVLRGLTFTYVLVAAGGGALITLTVLLAVQVLVVPSLGPALTLTVVDLAITSGLLVGSLAIGMSSPDRAGRKYLWGIVAFGLFQLSFPFIHQLWMAAVVLFVLGVANEFFGISLVTILQVYTEDETRGRVFAVRSTIARTATVIGLAGGGVAAQLYGVIPMFVALGVLFMVTGALGFAMPRLRNA